MDHARIDEMVAGLARVRDDDLRDVAGTSTARALLTELTTATGPATEPARPRPWRRYALALAAAAVVTTGVVVGPGMLGYRPGGATTYANAAIEVHREGDALVARIKDPLADGAKFVEAYRAFGQDVRIELVPVPPRLVGQLLQSQGGSGPVASDLVSTGAHPINCGQDPGACTLVVRIAADNSGTVRYTFGRAARSGEAYQPPWTR